jgi:hypothetical protein
MARPRSRLLDLERDDDVFYGACRSDHVSVAAHAIIGGAIFFLLLHLTARFLPAAAVSAVLYGACYYSILDRGEALLSFLCRAASRVLAARLGFSPDFQHSARFKLASSPSLGFSCKIKSAVAV